ncbi:uncharacterized protein LOC123442678 [Hordeum vulgare subsp. vulgare]|uniref:Uncharacterized protein n=1 Tax=Hordeum vulgare subsp. vulgare TaxID=112509 RepID=A0A8I6WWJ8_HORVV|nr:uncharacterized protein LOC123442678 [Hordeum vulgare subsp. vulgare]
MAATATDDFERWWETFNNGRTVDQGQHEDEDGTDSSDSGFELVQQQQENACVLAGEELAPDAHAPAGREGAARDCDVAEEGVSEDGHFPRQGELQGRNREAAAKLSTPRASEGEEEGEAEHVSGDNHIQIGSGLLEIQNKEGQDKYVSADKYVQIGGWEQGRKRKATVSVTPNGVQPIGIEIQNKTSHGECLRAENQMVRLQIVSKTEELDAEQVRRLKLELHLKTEENKSLKKQNEELRAENEYYRKTANPQKKRKAVRVL